MRRIRPIALSLAVKDRHLPVSITPPCLRTSLPISVASVIHLQRLDVGGLQQISCSPPSALSSGSRRLGLLAERCAQNARRVMASADARRRAEAARSRRFRKGKDPAQRLPAHVKREYAQKCCIGGSRRRRHRLALNRFNHDGGRYLPCSALKTW